MASRVKNLREELILAGIREINANGIQNFSVRRVAMACGVSCATPYKHFKDRQSFIAEIIGYINGIWAQRQKEVISRAGDSTREKLLEISKEYIRFLVENPYFRSILMLKDESFDGRYAGVKGRISPVSQQLINQYCEEEHIPEKTARLKTFIVRSLIYGAALMFDNEEIEYNEENMSLVAYAIDREFELD
ncbi:MAG: TetR/AcrR family transcriptional regulator [Oscillospiraceae bacterium]